MDQTSHCSTLDEGQRVSSGHDWRPTPAIRVSIAVHLTGLAGVVLDPVSWDYIAAAVAGNHVVLGLAGMWPRSTLLGSNLRRLPEESAARREIALTFDDGPDPIVTPRVLDLLDQHQAKASFFCVGTKAAAYPAIIQDIARRGHSVENHTHTHPAAFATYGVRRLRREIEACQETLAALCGRGPTFFRAPAGVRSPLLDPILARLGLQYVSWTRRAFDTVDHNPVTVLNRLARKLAAGDVLALHDGRAKLVRDRAPVVLEVLPRLMDKIEAGKLKPVALTTACRS
ncbi:MAG TPA: polysaccharide deacetylase family protein [Burkholderiales bacterium]